MIADSLACRLLESHSARCSRSFTGIVRAAACVLLLSSSQAGATTRWDIPLGHETFPDSKDLTAPIATLSVELEADVLCVHAQMQDKDISLSRGLRKPADTFGDTDSYMMIYIDLSGDSRFAQVFGVNIAGSVQDGLYRESGKNLDTGSDFEWEGIAKAIANGWQADFRIPLKALYGAVHSTSPPRIYAEYQHVGAAREVYATQDTSADGGCVMCHAPSLTGFPVIDSEGVKWSARPTVIFDSTQASSDSNATATDQSLNYGFDVTAQLSPNWTVAGTLHPNFADREPDQPVLTKDVQFSSFQPETRPFFALGSDLHPANGQVINTRQMADPSLAVQAIGRSGQVSTKWLYVDDSGGGQVILPGPYGNGSVVAPGSRNLIGREVVNTGGGDYGVTYTDRDYGTRFGANQTWSIDAHQRFAGDSQVSGIYVQSRTSACPEGAGLTQCDARDGYTAYATVAKTRDLLDMGAQVTAVSADFRNDLGFRPNNGFRIYNVWWWPSSTKHLPAGLARIDWQPQFAIGEDSEGRTNFRFLILNSQVTWKAGPTLTVTVIPVQQTKLGADQPMINDREVAVALRLSPSRTWYTCSVGANVGEVPDYFNARAGHGYGLNFTQQIAVRRTLSIQLTGSWASSRAAAVTVSGPTIREAAALLVVNYQYRGFSRVRWATQWQRSLGWELVDASGTPFSNSGLAHTLSWIHEPRVGWVYSVTLAQDANQANGTAGRNSRATAKVGYTFW